MKMTQENMKRFEDMVRDFANENNLKYTVRHLWNDEHTEIVFEILETRSRRVTLVEWTSKKSLSQAGATVVPEIKNVIFNDPATIILWEDGTKTVVKCQDGDVYSKETGLALCIAKKALGNKGNFNEVFKKWIPEEETCCAKPMTFMEVEISHDFIRSEDISKAVEKIFTDAWKNFKQRGVV